MNQDFQDKFEAAVNALPKATTLQTPADFPSYQSDIDDWMRVTFAESVVTDPTERAMRFLEESIELAQVVGLTEEEAQNLVRYVYGRPVGELENEVGGVMVTLAALCNTMKANIMYCAYKELDRISQIPTILKIRAKQATKPRMTS